MNYRKLNDYELINLVPEREDITDILFKKYRPLIIKIAKKLHDENLQSGLDINDLIQEGMIGFSTAINTYNEKKDAMFFTYARKCIETKIISAVITATRQKHKILNNSISMDAMNESEFSKNLDTFNAGFQTDPENITIDKESVTDLIKKLEEELTYFEGLVFELRINGFSYKEIANALDTNTKKVDNTLQKIKNKIKKYLDKQNN